MWNLGTDIEHLSLHVEVLSSHITRPCKLRCQIGNLDSHIYQLGYQHTVWAVTPGFWDLTWRVWMLKSSIWAFTVRIWVLTLPDSANWNLTFGIWVPSLSIWTLTWGIWEIIHTHSANWDLTCRIWVIQSSIWTFMFRIWALTCWPGKLKSHIWNLSSHMQHLNSHIRNLVDHMHHSWKLRPHILNLGAQSKYLSLPVEDLNTDSTRLCKMKSHIGNLWEFECPSWAFELSYESRKMRCFFEHQKYKSGTLYSESDSCLGIWEGCRLSDWASETPSPAFEPSYWGSGRSQFMFKYPHYKLRSHLSHLSTHTHIDHVKG